ncbi:DUF2946 family protein [Achromobacter kerstersii]|uniref:DUF2946 family protein n=1 Tax=Achromobacter kerstersii TaxID=1353890 RepID=UPI0015827B88|nr:DUF2946 family protein [Achromobacter kerstersii]
MMATNSGHRIYCQGFSTARAFALLWFTLAAVLFGSLAPSWAQVIVRASAGTSLSYIEVCTSSGLRRIAVDGGGQETDQPTPAPADAIDAVHCAFCLTQHQLPSLVPQIHRFDGIRAGLAMAPTADRGPTPTTAPRWRPPPRAPPAYA